MAAPDLDLVGAVTRAQQGDQAAFDVIYTRFADPLFRYLYARCGDAGLAEELVGDVWVRVVEHLPRFRFQRGSPEIAFTAWLYRIAYNLLVDTYRRRSNADVPLAETVVSRDVLPDEQALVLEEQRELRSAIEHLTPDQREVILLRFVDEHSNAEVARLTGRSEGAVKLLQHRALGALSRILGGRRR